MGAASARLTRRSGTSFYLAFLTLRPEKRRAIYALYSFCRGLDDAVDEEDGGGEEGLRRWLEEVDRCYAGRPQTALGRDLASALARFPIPRASFDEVAAGCRMDLARRRYAHYGELRTYCERVAAAVGLASIEVFGYRNPRTRGYAVELGVALQLTNILRDLGLDARRGRMYLPLEDLDRFGLSEAAFVSAASDGALPSGALASLLRFQAVRAEEQYGRAAALLPDEDRRAMRPARIMAAIYRRLLDEIVRRGHPFHPPVRLSLGRKARIALGVLLPGRMR